MKPISRLVFFILTIVCCYGCEKNKSDTATDFDGNVYTPISIGNQVWLRENMKTTHYRDGSAIPMVSDNNQWGSLSTPAYCWYDNDEASHKSPYGALYNWYVVENGKLCPEGWHVTTDQK